MLFLLYTKVRVHIQQYRHNYLIANILNNTYTPIIFINMKSSRVSLRVKVIKGHFHFRGRKNPYSIYK